MEKLKLSSLALLFSLAIVSSVRADANPEFLSLSIDTDIDSINVYWYVDHLGTNDIKVECSLNGNECDYTGEKGYGGCVMEGPALYDFTQDGDSPETVARTVVNDLQCETYNSSLINPSADQKGIKTLGFYPLAFKITMPSSMALTVGIEQDMAFNLKNNGTIDDQYQIEITTASPNFVIIENGEQRSETLSGQHSQQIRSGITLLSSEETPQLKLEIVSSVEEDLKIEDQMVSLKGDYMSLPGIRDMDIFSIIISAVILVSFLF